MIKFSCVVFLSAASFAAAQSPVPPNAKLDAIASGFQFVEGPVWKDGLGLLFSDIPANTVYRWTPDSGATVYLRPSSNSNGLTFDLQGRLLLAQTGTRRVARLEPNGTQTALASTYLGKKLNSPNDLAVKSDGSIFFTDPPFNIPAGQTKELSFSGIFRISPSGNLQLLDSSLALPNGICFSPDESTLYVNNSSERVIYAWDILNDSTIANKRRFASINPVGYADGMKVDAAGNTFCSGPLGVWVFAPNGTVLDTILVPGQTANCNWGDADRKTLYITASTAVYRIRLTTATGIKNRGSVFNGVFQLYTNYPNPFNPKTTIEFSIPREAHVSLEIFNSLGQQVSLLEDQKLPAGDYRQEWNAATLPSGTYFCRLQADRLVQTKKVLLLK
jgi:gluconolactonase